MRFLYNGKEPILFGQTSHEEKTLALLNIVYGWFGASSEDILSKIAQQHQTTLHQPRKDASNLDEKITTQVAQLNVGIEEKEAKLAQVTIQLSEKEALLVTTNEQLSKALQSLQEVATSMGVKLDPSLVDFEKGTSSFALSADQLSSSTKTLVDGIKSLQGTINGHDATISKLQQKSAVDQNEVITVKEKVEISTTFIASLQHKDESTEIVALKAEIKKLTAMLSVQTETIANDTREKEVLRQYNQALKARISLQMQQDKHAASTNTTDVQSRAYGMTMFS